MISQSDSDLLVSRLESIPGSGPGFRARAMELLKSLPNYNWCGVYRLEGKTLVLDAFVGAGTEHTHIPVGQGVCGTAVAENRNQVVQDVRVIANYLACSTQTRSEIVVLIRRRGEILGQIDVDGHTVGAFDHSDEALLAVFAAALGERWD